MSLAEGSPRLAAQMEAVREERARMRPLSGVSVPQGLSSDGAQGNARLSEISASAASMEASISGRTVKVLQLFSPNV